ncbi:transposase [Methylomonas sp. CM2]|uniref:transposase n=1 Tax=Methylomonas sp. CM2 TaxID=3417647 RepID=UPI003CF1123F
MFDDQNLFGLAQRQASRMVASILKLFGLDRVKPYYPTLCRCQQHVPVCISYRAHPNGLRLLVDRSAVKMLGEGKCPKHKCKTKKPGVEYRRQSRKVQLGVDAETPEFGH